MKKINSALVAVFIAVLAFVNYSYAQVESNNLTVNEKKPLNTPAIISTTANTVNGGDENLTNINQKAVRVFEKTFKNASVDYWDNVADGYVVKFKWNGIQNKAYFDKTGSLVYTLKNYTGDKLPGDVRAIVKGVYYDYTIFWVEELNVLADKNIIYVVHLEGNTSWKNVTVCNGEMNLLKEMAK